ncbi:hypothetical protein CVS40_5455 [Lucilia cuprina]|nr:hypothetical protein CVS40_5455 [Lucilia cuprina]
MNVTGILMTDKIKRSLIGLTPISERLISARFRTKFRNITNFPQQTQKNAFYEQLDAEIAKSK